MRRHDRELTSRKDLDFILRHGEVCRLAINTGRAPYIVPLNYGYEWKEKLTIFFHGAGQGRKHDLLQQDNRVGFEIDIGRELVRGKTACAWGMKYQSLIGSGKISYLTDAREKIAALQLLMEQYGHEGSAEYSLPMLDQTQVLCLLVDEMTGKAKD